MFEVDEIKKRILAGLSCSFVDVASEDGVHFAAIVVSEHFVGNPLVTQHRLVKNCLGHLVGNEIHALQLKTYTPEAWDKVKSELGYSE